MLENDLTNLFIQEFRRDPEKAFMFSMVDFDLVQRLLGYFEERVSAGVTNPLIICETKSYEYFERQDGHDHMLSALAGRRMGYNDDSGES